MVDDLVAMPEAGVKAHATSATLAPAGLLPAEQCDQKALKARFGKVAEAQAWVESQNGKAPEKPTWLVIEQTCRSGSWPAVAKRAAASPKGVSAEQLEERLSALEACLSRRFDRQEHLLLLLAEVTQPSG